MHFMSESQNRSETPFGKLAGSVSLLAVALLFTGWIYRWSYFTYFQVEPDSLGYPLESISITAFSLLFRSPWSILKFGIGLVLAFLGIVVTFRVIGICNVRLAPHFRTIVQRIGLSGEQRLLLLLMFSLANELVTILWLLLILYGLAASQGLEDAHRDALDETSTLPVITIAMPGKQAVIGRDPNQILVNPSNVRLFGGRERYDALIGDELNSDSGKRRWRLLSDSGGKLLVIPTLPSNQIGGKSPAVLIFPDGGKGDRLVILSPAQSS
jgi:hypothetical protein